MAIRDIDSLLTELSSGGSSSDKIETRLIVDLIDTLVSLQETNLSDGTAIIVLPEEDPEIVGALWNDSGTITVSAG